MFSPKSRAGIAIHVLLIAVILFTALVPTAAMAMSPAEESDVSSRLPVNSPGRIGSAHRYINSSLRAQNLFQDGTPTTSPVETVTETPAAGRPRLYRVQQ